MRLAVRVNNPLGHLWKLFHVLESEENKMNRQDFLKLKKSIPAYNNGRQVKVYHYGSKGAQGILYRAISNEGYNLHDVYKTPSIEKQRAFDDVYKMFLADETADGFKICSHNCQSFSVSWSTPTCVEFITSKIEHIVVF